MNVNPISEIVDVNSDYVKSHMNFASSLPSRRLAIVTCMDTRLDVLAILGLKLGQTQILRNAGGRVTDDVLRSLALSCQVFDVKAVLQMQHTQCGLAGVNDEQLRYRTGADIDFLAIEDHETSLRHDIEILASKPYLAPLELIAGLLFDTESGKVLELAR